jgi:ABC-type bacteriocin/lantibiotic exporter with double-glycine peptidase domain
MKKIIIVLIASCCFAFQAKAQIRTQEQSMWCWASCIQSALGQAYVNVTQADVVSRLNGWPQNRPARNAELIYVLNSYNFQAWEVPYPANYQQLYNTLTSGWKLVAFVNPTNNPQVGHYIMLQGISPTGNIVISDPANGATYEQHPEQLYYAWNWSSSIVVGVPQ